MNGLLSFFSDLILFSFGLAICFAWIIFFVVIGIEIWDTIKEIVAKEDTDVQEDVRQDRHQ